jgi:hypothetical protein
MAPNHKILLAKWELRKNTTYENFKMLFRQNWHTIFSRVLLEIWNGKSEPVFPLSEFCRYDSNSHIHTWRLSSFEPCDDFFFMFCWPCISVSQCVDWHLLPLLVPSPGRYNFHHKLFFTINFSDTLYLT